MKRPSIGEGNPVEIDEEDLICWWRNPLSFEESPVDWRRTPSPLKKASSLMLKTSPAGEETRVR